PRSFAHNAGSPSKVVIALPLTAATGVTHDRISFPSNSTEQAPHCARPQPKRGPCRWSSLCRTYRSGVSRLAVTLCTRPLTLIFNLLAIPTLQSNGDAAVAKEVDSRDNSVRDLTTVPGTNSRSLTKGRRPGSVQRRQSTPLNHDVVQEVLRPTQHALRGRPISAHEEAKRAGARRR